MKKLTLLTFSLFLSLWVLGKTPQPKLHLLLMSMTADLSIGESCQANYSTMLTVAEQVAQNSNLQLNTQILKGSDLYKEAVWQLLDSLEVGKNDVVWFYYSGHGINANRKSQWSRLMVQGAGLPLELDQIHTLLKQKEGRLTITMGDCCNVAIEGGETEMIESVSVQSGEELQANEQATLGINYTRLFKNMEGDILMSGCLKGQSSYANPILGGFFTLSFRQILNNLTLSSETYQANWVNLLEQTRDLTQKNALSVYHQQTPQFQVNLRPIQNLNREGEAVIDLN